MTKLIAVLATLSLSVLALLGVLPNGSAQAAAPAGHTAVTVEVSGCRGCQISASSWVRLHTEPWTSVARTVRNGRVTFYPPTGRTRGLTFTVSDRHAVNDGAVPVAIMRYSGTRAGHDVAARTARTTRSGFICWAGTKRRTATLHMTVDHFAGTSIDGTPGYGDRPYVDPAGASIGTRRHLVRGLYEVQDVPLCFG